MSLVGGLILYRYSTVFSSKPPLVSLEQRVALQGHLWWGVDLHYLQGTLPIPPAVQRGNELRALMSPGGPKQSEPVGMTLLMRTVAPTRLVDGYIKQGIRFTMGFPAIGLYLFGPYGLVVVEVLAALFVVLSAWYLLSAIWTARVLRGLVAYKIFLLGYEVLTVGNLYEVLSYKSLLYLSLALLVEAYYGATRSIPRTYPA